MISRVTQGLPKVLRVGVSDWEGETAFRKNIAFSAWVANELTVESYSANAGDSLTYHSTSPFTTVWTMRNDNNRSDNCDRSE